jgi:hypothetical protein
MASTRTRVLAGVLAMAGAGCGAGPPAPERGAGEGMGTIAMALTSMAGSTMYVLANATFMVERIQPPPSPGDISGSVSTSRIRPPAT